MTTNAEIVAAVTLFEDLIRSNPHAPNASSMLDHVNRICVFAVQVRPELKGLSAGRDDERTYTDTVDGVTVVRDPRAERRARLAQLAAQ